MSRQDYTQSRLAFLLRFSKVSLPIRYIVSRLAGICALVVLCLLVSVDVLRADELYLRDGRVVTGAVTQDGNDYVVSFAGGASVRYSAAEVLRVQEQATVRERYANLKAVVNTDDFKEQMELAKWCRLNQLPKEAKEHFHRAAELRPDDVAALKGAGYILFEGRWVTREEALQLQGRTVYNGKEMTILEAEEQKQRIEIKRLQEEGYSKAWRLLRSAAERKSDEEYAQIRQELREMGALAGGAVLRCATDSNPRVRSLCLEVLGSDEQKESRIMLFTRLRFEPAPKLVHKAARLLAARSDREAVLRQALNVCLKASFRGTRQRSWLVMRYASDKQVLAQLIEAVEYCPVPEGSRKGDNKNASSDGWQSSEDTQRLRTPYYPACEALNFLTGANISPSKERWQKWWEEHGANFDFKTRTSEPEDDTEAEKESDAKEGQDDNKAKSTVPEKAAGIPAAVSPSVVGKKDSGQK